MKDRNRRDMPGPYRLAPARASAGGWALIGVAVAAGASAACGTGGSPAPAEPLAPPEAVPEAVSVPGARVEVGFARGRSRRRQDVPGSRVAKHPVTRARYAECVAAGACGAPGAAGGECAAGEGGATERGAGAARAPELCATASQAARYCRWVGGALPALEQWLLAARGPEVRRHPWGEELASCEQHPQAADCAEAEGVAPVGGEGAALARPVGKHPAGASPSGVEDVLLVRRERVTASAGSAQGACAGEGGCVVSGRDPGAIDGVEVGNVAAAEQPPAMFRCVWEVTP